MKLWLGFVLLLQLAVMTGCGSGGAESTADRASSDPLADYPPGPTREFIVIGGDNAIPLFGDEASAAERRQASSVLQRWMRAREARDFAEECRYFSRSYIKALVEEDAEIVSKGKAKTCPQALDYFGSAESGDFKNTLAGPVDSLRVAEGHGYAQYHGREGFDYEIPMEREKGKWLVANGKPLNQEG